MPRTGATDGGRTVVEWLAAEWWLALGGVGLAGSLWLRARRQRRHTIAGMLRPEASCAERR